MNRSGWTLRRNEGFVLFVVGWQLIPPLSFMHVFFVGT